MRILLAIDDSKFSQEAVRTMEGQVESQFSSHSFG